MVPKTIVWVGTSYLNTVYKVLCKSMRKRPRGLMTSQRHLRKSQGNIQVFMCIHVIGQKFLWFDSQTSLNGSYLNKCTSPAAYIW